MKRERILPLEIGIHLLVITFAVACALPFIHVIAVSFAERSEAYSSQFLLFPRRFSLANYRQAFASPEIARFLLNSIIITVSGTVVSLVATSIFAYPLAVHGGVHRGVVRVVTIMVMLTLVLRPGLVPAYLVVSRYGLLNTYWALILPRAITAFYLFILINFFRAIPPELRESAIIDGASEPRILAGIVMPLSKPVLASLTLFFAVGYWNLFLPAILYLSEPIRFPIQVALRNLVLLSEGLAELMDPDLQEMMPDSKGIRMAVIVIATVPILLLYPFLQRHFAKGVMLGSVKG